MKVEIRDRYCVATERPGGAARTMLYSGENRKEASLRHYILGESGKKAWYMVSDDGVTPFGKINRAAAEPGFVLPETGDMIVFYYDET